MFSFDSKRYPRPFILLAFGPLLVPLIGSRIVDHNHLCHRINLIQHSKLYLQAVVLINETTTDASSPPTLLIVESGRLYSAPFLPEHPFDVTLQDFEPSLDWLHYFATKNLLPQEALTHLTAIDRTRGKWLHTVRFDTNNGHRNESVTVLQDATDCKQSSGGQCYYLITTEPPNDRIRVIKTEHSHKRAEENEHRVFGSSWVFFKNALVLNLPRIQVTDLDAVSRNATKYIENFRDGNLIPKVVQSTTSKGCWLEVANAKHASSSSSVVVNCRQNEPNLSAQLLESVPLGFIYGSSIYVFDQDTGMVHVLVLAVSSDLRVISKRSSSFRDFFNCADIQTPTDQTKLGPSSDLDHSDTLVTTASKTSPRTPLVLALVLISLISITGGIILGLCIMLWMKRRRRKLTRDRIGGIATYDPSSSSNNSAISSSIKEDKLHGRFMLMLRRSHTKSDRRGGKRKRSGAAAKKSIPKRKSKKSKSRQKKRKDGRQSSESTSDQVSSSPSSSSDLTPTKSQTKKPKAKGAITKSYKRTSERKTSPGGSGRHARKSVSRARNTKSGGGINNNIDSLSDCLNKAVQGPNQAKCYQQAIRAKSDSIIESTTIGSVITVTTTSTSSRKEGGGASGAKSPIGQQVTTPPISTAAPDTVTKCTKTYTPPKKPYKYCDIPSSTGFHTSTANTEGKNA